MIQAKGCKALQRAKL